MTDIPHRFTIIQHPEVHPPESEASLVPNRVLRHLYATVQRFQIIAPHLPSAPPPAVAVSAQSCLLSEITAAICARKHDRLFNAGTAARLAHGEAFAELLSTSTASVAGDAPAPAAAHDALLPGVHDRFSLDQFAATLAFISKLRAEQCVFFVLMRDSPLDASFRQCLRACAECRLPVLLYFETGLRLSAPNRARRNPQDLRSLYAEIGVPLITTDVHDPVALYRVTTEAVNHARFGQGPTVIESTKVIASGRRSRLATPDDPLDFMKSYMQARGAWDEAWAQAQRQTAVEELRAALAACGR